MNDLIKVNTDGSGKQTVNARNLHEFLESKQDFSTWIKTRIKQYGFAEGLDYACLHKKMEANNAVMIEYHISIDMAKELSMVERNEKGKQARQYFIECEHRAMAPMDPTTALNDPPMMRQLLLTYCEKVIALEDTVKTQAPKVAALDRISTANGSVCITDTAKTLQIQPKILFQWMHASGWIYKRAGGGGSWIAYQNRLKQNVLEHKVTVVIRGDGSEKSTLQVLVTPKGLTVLSEKLNVEESIFA